MFWSFVLCRLQTLLHWQVWVALIFYVALNFAWLFIIGLLMDESESGGRMAADCLTHLIGGSIYQAILLGLLVFLLMPITLGGNQFMPFSLK